MDFRMVFEGVEVHFVIKKDKIYLSCGQNAKASIFVKIQDDTYVLEDILEIPLKEAY